jgi:NAD(P)-dependent dehydrogenase (short-subunit alcohol dehydrogenase family)
LEAARHFTRLKAAKVILACRSIEKGEIAKNDIERTTDRKNVVEVWQVDPSSFDSVRQFCARAQGLDRLDILIENAGIATPIFEQFEGYESTITVNVISTFLMALLLLPKMRDCATDSSITSRITIVSSDAHQMLRIFTISHHNWFANYFHIGQLGCDVLHLYVVQPRNLLVFGLSRARRGQLERCRCIVVVVAPACVGRQDR